jgi:glycosyltransferase involved in cell wall biosynthesis
MLIAGDTAVIGECAYRSGISQNVVDRLRLFNGLDASVLYPPLPLAGRYYSADPEPYILSVGRICSIKRVDLMVKALPSVPRHVRLKVVGVPDEAGVLEYLQNEAEKHHIADRIDFLGRVSDDALLDLYARALAVYYAPFDEDYGYVTLEAMASGRPVITAWDSGGTLEFVEQGISGIVTDPTPDGMAEACCRLDRDRDLCRRLGMGGLQRIQSSGVAESGWHSVIEGLLSPLSSEMEVQ